MLKGKQPVMGLKNMWKGGYANKHMKAEAKQTKIKVSSNGITHARIGLHPHEFHLRAQARSCIHKSLPRKPN